MAATAAVALVELKAVGQQSVQGVFTGIGHSAEKLGRQGGTALRTVAQATASIADAGKVSGGSLATILGQLGDLALGFGKAGPLVGAIAVAGGVIAKLFLNTREEFKRTREAEETEISNMLNAGNYEKLAQKAREIEFGTASKPGGLDALKQQLAAAQQWINDHPLAIFAVGEKEHEIDQLRDKIKPLQEEWDKVTTALNTPQIAAHQAGFAQGMTIVAGATDTATKSVADQVSAYADLAKQGRLTTADLGDALALQGRLEQSMTTGTAAIRAQTGALHDRLAAAIDVSKGMTPSVKTGTLDDATLQGALGLGGAAQAKQEQDLVRLIQAAMQRIIDQTKHLAKPMSQTLGVILGSSISSGLVDGIANAFGTIFDTGSIGKGFEALGATLASGIGRALVSFGKASLLASSAMLAIQKALRSFDPTGGVLASLAAIAIGEGLIHLAGAAESSFGNMGNSGVGGGASSSYSAPAPRPEDVLRVRLGPTSATTAAGMTPVQPMNVTVIGPNDPVAQRQIGELFRNAARRGLVPV